MKLFIMKRILIIFLFASLYLGARAQDSLSISLLTCSQGGDISSAFGHSAIRVKDIQHGRDLVFNYGTFSFNEPHFMLNFLRGDLNYFLSVSSFNQFKESYERAGRGITEQQLNRIRAGVEIERGVVTKKCKVNVIETSKTYTKLRVVITEGKNREIRRMFEAVGKNVDFLKRLKIGDLALTGLDRGAVRRLTQEEVFYLKNL